MIFGLSSYTIEDVQLFRGANMQAVTELLMNCPVQRISAGQTLSAGGDKTARLYIVLSGALEATQGSSGGGDATLTRVMPGECIGELSVLDEEVNPLDISAQHDTDVLIIDAKLMWQLIDESNSVARNLLRLLSFRIRAANAQLRRRHKLGEFYRQLSMVDGLTGLQNRAWLNDQLPRLIERAHTADTPLLMIMMDLDHFKQFNDEHGHLAGDDALRVAARVLNSALRPTDYAVRFGGEEFMVLLPDTQQKFGIMVAQRLCTRMQQAVVFNDMRKALPHISASFGVARLMPGQNAEQFTETTDQALYRAKENGRNRIDIAPDQVLIA